MIDPVWIVKALGLVTAVAAVCGYLTLCFLFAHGQWQLVLAPSRTVSQTPAAAGVAFDEVHFGPDASGQPQLDGWWIPSDLPSDPTVLMLHSGNGSEGDALPQVRALHDARLNVLLFDYRGFGHSSGQHPAEALMEQDSDAALAYLTQFRHVLPASMLIYGTGVGASLAVRLCAQHQNIAAMVLEDADGDFESRVRRDSRARMVPVGLLFHEQFPLADRLHTLATPKLLLSLTDATAAPVDFQRAAYPRMIAEIAPNDSPALHSTLRRFIDTYVSHGQQIATP